MSLTPTSSECREHSDALSGHTQPRAWFLREPSLRSTRLLVCTRMQYPFSQTLYTNSSVSPVLNQHTTVGAVLGSSLFLLATECSLHHFTPPISRSRLLKISRSHYISPRPLDQHPTLDLTYLSRISRSRSRQLGRSHYALTLLKSPQRPSKRTSVAKIPCIRRLRLQEFK